ncbi:MAG: hypothetical protein ACKOYJ_08485 [Planctomycetia bacterium]
MAGMIVGVPKETNRDEYRIAVVPVGVEDLVRAGPRVLVRRSDVSDSGLADESPSIRSAVKVLDGRLVCQVVADAFGMKP